VRIRIDLAYDGADFHGWAAQPGLRTVEGELTSALATVLRLPQVAVTCAGRTDTGVHARGQVAHADLPEEALSAVAGRSDTPPPEALARRLNGLLADDVRVLLVRVAPDGFDARFSAMSRRYAYRLADPDARADPLTRGLVVAWPRRLDLTAMNAAGALLVGEHDFAAFCRRREGATTVRRILDLHWDRDAAGLLTATVRADAFCHTMVRSLVGCLVTVGEGRRPPDWAGDVLAARVRDSAVPVVAAAGLTLEEVVYPPDDELAAQAARTRRVRVL
jgi:tRNA pseudouridine38-40 synthase